MENNKNYEDWLVHAELNKMASKSLNREMFKSKREDTLSQVVVYLSHTNKSVSVELKFEGTDAIISVSGGTKEERLAVVESLKEIGINGQ